MRYSLYCLLLFAVIFGGVMPYPAKALVQMMLADPSLIAHGWPAPGGVLNISTNVTANVSGIPPVTIGYAIINQATGTVLTTQAAAFTLTQGQPAPLSMTIQIPRQALEGKYRAELRVSNGATVLWTDPRSACFTITTAPPPSDGFQIPVRGCSELPSSATNPAMNYVYASGSQIVDANGTPLRISSIGWSGTGGAAGWASDGLWMLNYKRVMESFKSEGFNAIRIPWTDAILYERASQAQSFIDAGFSSNNAELRDPAFPNPDAQGFYTYKKTIDIFQYYADYAAQIGLKIIFEHHSNRGYNGQQQNGLWFSKDLARNYCSDGQYVQGVDGSDASPSATFGRCDSPDSPPSNYVDYATFKQNWVTLAAKFNGHPAVIGFELDNEPGNMWSPCPATGAWTYCVPVQINWGVTNDPYDIQWMAQDVGNAIHAVNPNALIILETLSGGYNGSPVPYWVAYPKPPGTDPSVSAGNGDLTAVAAYANKPVVLTRPHKLSYSVHLYPYEISGDPTQPPSSDYSPNYWMPSFGYVDARNISPILVTETGACIAQGNTSQDALNFLNSVISFLNGRTGPTWGPTLYANRQGWSTSWWLGTIYTPDGNPNDCTHPGDKSPNGLWSAWPSGNNYVPFTLNRPETLAYTDQLMFKGAGDISPDNTVVGAGGSIIDASLNVWAVMDGKVIFNGAADSTTTNAATVAYADGKICYQNTAGQWYCKFGFSFSNGGVVLVLANPFELLMLLIHNILMPNSSLPWTPTLATWIAGASPLRPSPNGFVSTQGGPPVIDAAGNFWSLGFGRVMVNGEPDNDTNLGVQIAYYGGKIWHMNTSGDWYSKTSPTQPWSAASTNPLPAQTAAKIVTEGGGAIIDANQNSWTIVEGTVVVNGIPDGTTANVIELAYYNGKIWQKNANWLWWSKTLPSDAWGPVGGQAERPGISTSANRTTVLAGGGSIVTPTSGSWDWTISDGKVVIDGVVDETTRNVVQLSYFNNKVWQKNSAGDWRYKSSYFGIWTPSLIAPF